MGVNWRKIYKNTYRNRGIGNLGGSELRYLMGVLGVLELPRPTILGRQEGRLGAEGVARRSRALSVQFLAEGRKKDKD